jgi:hypothetical protein
MRLCTPRDEDICQITLEPLEKWNRLDPEASTLLHHAHGLTGLLMARCTTSKFDVSL